MQETPITRERELRWVRTDQIVKNPRNPRQAASMKPELLEDLRRSIRAHGILEALIVQRYDEDMYQLLEGERRWHSAKLEGIKEIPVVVVNDLDPDDQVVVMYNIHTNRKGWEKYEELMALKQLLAKNGQKADTELARELGISVATFRDRLAVLQMGDEVVSKIGRGEIDYTAALRADQVTRTLSRNRPDLVQELGGAGAVEKKLIAKAKARGSRAKGQQGLVNELVQARPMLADPGQAPDPVVRRYVDDPDVTWRQVMGENMALAQQHKADSFAKDVASWTREIKRFEVALEALPNLPTLRAALTELIEAATGLEQRVVEETVRRRN